MLTKKETKLINQAKHIKSQITDLKEKLSELNYPILGITIEKFENMEGNLREIILEMRGTLSAIANTEAKYDKNAIQAQFKANRSKKLTLKTEEQVVD